ncbi:MAG: HlyD family secretion protein [Bacteroidales bacterium]|nr:HlyD family secretion protein [Bacteroidales bacterium]
MEQNKATQSAKQAQEENVKAAAQAEQKAAQTKAAESQAEAAQPAEQPAPAVDPKEIKKPRGRRLVVSLVMIGLIAYGLWKLWGIFNDYNENVTCNDAQVEQYISPVNLRASGYIAKVCFKEHQQVHKGDTLLILDDREYRIRLMEAEAALSDAMAGGNVMNATEQKAQSSATVYDASTDEIEVRLAKLAKDIERYRNLVENKAATPIQLEQLEVEYEATKKKLESVKKQQDVAYKGVTEVTTRKQNVAAAIKRAQAAVEMAKLNLSYCVVVAPCDGKLGRRTIEEGQMVNAGTTITYIMPGNQKWVIANFKETQIEQLRMGQKVSMTVDAVSGKTFEGTITAVSGATGSKYSLVPTDNSAGNFVKIQQRVPVRIDFTNLSKEDNDRLAAGMMVVVKAAKIQSEESDK